MLRKPILRKLSQKRIKNTLMSLESQNTSYNDQITAESLPACNKFVRCHIQVLNMLQKNAMMIERAFERGNKTLKPLLAKTEQRISNLNKSFA